MYRKNISQCFYYYCGKTKYCSSYRNRPTPLRKFNTDVELLIGLLRETSDNRIEERSIPQMLPLLKRSSVAKSWYDKQLCNYNQTFNLLSVNQKLQLERDKTLWEQRLKANYPLMFHRQLIANHRFIMSLLDPDEYEEYSRHLLPFHSAVLYSSNKKFLPHE